MYKFPVTYFENNLIFNNSKKQCWAVFKMDGYNYDYKSVEKKISILNSLARFIARIGTEGKILIIPVSQDVDTHYSNLMDGMHKKDILFEKAQAHAQGTCRYLKDKIAEKGSSNDYITYVLTKIKLGNSVVKDIEEVFNSFIRSPIQSVYEFFSVETKEILKREIESFMNLANDYLKDQRKRVSIRAADALDIQWLFRRMFRRGLGEVKLRYNLSNGTKVPWIPFSERIIKNGEVAVRPHRKDILSLTEGLVDTRQNRCLRISHGDGRESWQAFMPIAHIPDGIEFPGNEWLLVLQDYPMQTEVCIHIETVEHQQSIKDISGQKREIQSQIDHILDNNEDVPDELSDSKVYADQLEAELKATRAPIARVSVTFCVSADSKEVLEDRANFIKEIYEDWNFIIERPVADQMKLFMEFIPGAGRYMTDYVLPLPPRTLAGGIIGAASLLGDNEGPYIGTTGILEKNVYLNMGRACQLDRSASAAFLGTLGGGKSFNANLLLYLNLLYYGGYGLIFDPKGERTKWLKLLPELEGQINIITLQPGEEDRGKLDPFMIYREDLEQAGELALNVITEVFKINPKDDEYLVVLEAIKYTKQHPTPCMGMLADRLLDFPEDDEFAGVARRVGRRIKLLREAGMASLLFGTGTQQGLSIRKRLNIIQIQNLTLPDPGVPKEDYTQEETISTVLMLPLASFAKKFAMSGRDFFKIILFDESWALSATAMGIKIMNFLARMGRSLNAGCIFIGHSVNDLKGEGIKNAISYKFCFKTTENTEVKRVLEFLDLEVTEDNIQEVKNLQNRECLFQDIEGRVGKLRFDAVFTHLIRAFETTPKKKEKEGETDALPA